MALFWKIDQKVATFTDTRLHKHKITESIFILFYLFILDAGIFFQLNVFFISQEKEKDKVC